MRDFIAKTKSWFSGLLGGGGQAAPPSWSQRAWREPPRANARGVVALYGRSPELRKVVSKVAQSISGAEWSYKGPNAREWERIWARPNPYMSGEAWRGLEQIYLDLLGESVGVVMQGERGAEYYPVPPFLARREETGWRIQLGGETFDYADSEVCWIRHLDPLDPYGRGAGLGQVLVDEAESAEYAAKHSKAFFYNNATPELLIMGPIAAPDQLEKMEKRWAQRNQSFRNAWRTAFLSGEWRVERLTSDFGKLGLTEYRQFLSNVIRQTYGVPPEIVGQLDQSNKATITAAELIYARHVLLPRLRFARAEYAAQLLPMLGLPGTLAFTSPVPEDREHQLELVKIAPHAFTLNEIRGLAGLEPRSGLDVRAVSPTLTEVPAGRLASQARDIEGATVIQFRSNEAA